MRRHRHSDPDAARVLPRRDAPVDPPSCGRLTDTRLTEIRQWIASGQHNDRTVIAAVAREMLSQGAI
ncbi:MAG: hypothetical protein WEE89_05705 [Gemmatimonadota bacterium]